MKQIVERASETPDVPPRRVNPTANPAKLLVRSVKYLAGLLLGVDSETHYL